MLCALLDGMCGGMSNIMFGHKPGHGDILSWPRFRHEKSAGTAGVPGEHFGWLGNILDQNLHCFVAFYSLSEITHFSQGF